MGTGEPPVESGGTTGSRVPGPPRSGGPGVGQGAVLRSCATRRRRPSRRRPWHLVRARFAEGVPSVLLSLSVPVPRYVGSFRRLFRGDLVTRSADSSSEPGRAPIPVRETAPAGAKMRLIVFTVVAASVAGLLAGGTFRDFPSTRLRSAWLALAGVVLQFIPRRRDARDHPALRVVRRPARVRGPQHPGARGRADPDRPGVERDRDRREPGDAGDAQRSGRLQSIGDPERVDRQRRREAPSGRRRRRTSFRWGTSSRWGSR